MNDNVRLTKVAEQIYKRYTDFYGKELIHGCEFLIAEELAKTTGATIKIGQIISNEFNNRNHAWCIINGVTLDPVFNHIKHSDPSALRREITVEEGELPIQEFEAIVARFRVYQV